MRGKKYKFIGEGINIGHPFRIFYNNKLSKHYIAAHGAIEFTISENHSTTLGHLYYRCHNHSYMKGNMHLLYKEIIETDEIRAYYDFYYGTINISVSDDFGLASVYCYYHGYMGGKNLLQYSTDCSNS